MATQPPDDVLNGIKDALFRGDKIAAIKLYRENAKVDLKDAKEAVEALEAQLRAESPGRFMHPAGKGGCAGVLAGGLTLAALGLWAASEWIA